MTKAHKIVAVIAGVLVVLLFCLTVYFNPFSRTEKKVLGAVLTSDTSSWTTYQNKKYGIEFKYPSNWTNSYDDSNGVSLLFSFPDGSAGLSYSSQDLISQGSLDKNVATFMQGEGKSIQWEKQIPVGNGTGFYAVFSTPGNGTEPTLYLVSANGLWILHANDAKWGNEILQIASTFKFNQTSSTSDTSTWKTYRNEKYSFEIKIPSDWQIEDDDSYIHFPNTDTYIYFSDRTDSNIMNVSRPEINNQVFLRYQFFGDIASSVNYQLERNNKVLDFVSQTNNESRLHDILSTFKFTN